MIKTFNINLAGQIFNVNEDAYELLSGYFNSLRSFYKDEEEKDEIIRDIEGRFAELFLAKGKNYIITREDAAQVMNMMGNPQQFDGDREMHETIPGPETAHSKKRKRLYRDTDNSLVAGVCSGLSSYLGMHDPIWIRLIFVLLTIFTATLWMLIIYPVLWFVIPEAVTSTEKLEMKGEPINLSNIQKTVREESANMQNTITEKKGFANSLMSFLGACVKIFFKFLLGIAIVILGCILLCLALALLGIFIALMVLAVMALLGIPLVNNIFFINPTDGWFLGLGGLLLGFIPIIFIVLALVHFLSKKSKPLTKRVIFPLFGLFMFGILLVNISGYHAKQLTAERRHINQMYGLNYNNKSDTLQITMNPEMKEIDEIDDGDVTVNGIGDLFDLIRNEKDKLLKVKIEIYPSLTDSFTVIKEYSANGKTESEAQKNATSFTHNIRQVNNKLIIDPYIELANSHVKLRNQKLKIKIFVPEGKVIRWDQRVERFMDEDKLPIIYGDVVDHREIKRIRMRLVPNAPIQPSPPSDIPTPPSPPGEPTNVTIQINPGEDLDVAMDKAEREIEKAFENSGLSEERQEEYTDSIKDIISTYGNYKSRFHFIFRMHNGELVAID